MLAREHICLKSPSCIGLSSRELQTRRNQHTVCPEAIMPSWWLGPHRICVHLFRVAALTVSFTEKLTQSKNPVKPENSTKKGASRGLAL